MMSHLPRTVRSDRLLWLHVLPLACRNSTVSFWRVVYPCRTGTHHDFGPLDFIQEMSWQVGFSLQDTWHLEDWLDVDPLQQR
jgi:hypothetical protein